jgi:5,10-methylene-tetrahydrofolate dehydrogenase/methenyl tetrahydrofolate cyclohydrolase
LSSSPLPDHIDPNQVITAIDPDKDVDGFHPINAGRLASAFPASSRARRSAASSC